MKRFTKRAILLIFSALILLAVISFGYIYANQSDFVQGQLQSLNESYEGEISLGKSHLALFETFPYISLKIDDVSIREFKTENAAEILSVGKIYVGFSFWDIIRQKFDIQSLIIEDGRFDMVLHPDGSTNIENALAVESDDTSATEPIDIHLKEIELRNIEFHQREEATNLDIATQIAFANGGFQSRQSVINAHVDTEFILDVISDGDTTYFNNKHFELHTDLSYFTETGLLQFQPSGISMEHGDFNIEGSIETQNEMTVDLQVNGTKPSFDMFIAFAPTEIIPVLERYENAGNIYFNAQLKGPTTNGRQPYIEAKFGASDAFLENTQSSTKIDEMGFSGYLSNGAERELSSMRFTMEGISATLEQGKITGAISVYNFEEPDIDMSIDADFNLEFWANFLSLEEIEELQGKVDLKMKFHDIIDVDNPEKVLEDLSQAYFAELHVEDVAFSATELIPAAVSNLHIDVAMNGTKADLKKFAMQMGNSDIEIHGSLSDLPAIVHRRPNPVEAHLDIVSNLIDLKEITGFSAKDSTGMDEQIKNLRTGFSFYAKGNAFAEYSYLPRGKFAIDSFCADLKNYQHNLHDFGSEIVISDSDLVVNDFSGQIDSSDFHFKGRVKDYGFWMADTLEGDTRLDMNLNSNLLRFSNVFSYNGINYIPPEYRHEQLENLNLHFTTRLHFDSSELVSAELNLDKWQGKMNLHPLQFEDFSGKFTWTPKQLKCQDFTGKLGRTRFNADLNYFFEGAEQKQNLLSLQSEFIDFDELSNFSLEPEQESEESEESEESQQPKTTDDAEEHAEAFNIFEVPFPNLKMNIDVAHFIYHRYDLQNINATLRSTKQHYLYLDSLSSMAAGGSIAMNGYFNGSDSERIYLNPKLRLKGVDLEKLLFKFENFGQDAIVSDNLKGKLTADIWGNIRMYPDLVPDIDQSEIHLDALVLNGALVNYEPMLLLTDYFDENALRYIQFDTLQNHIDITEGLITIPSMNIESTLGHMEISGTQDMNDNINYHMKIPWSLVKEAAKNKFLGNRKSDSDSNEIIKVAPGEDIKYLNVNVVGTVDDFDIKLRKPKP